MADAETMRSGAGPRTGSPHRHACRLVTTVQSARLLLRGQLSALNEIKWTIVAGDRHEGEPLGFPIDHVPMRREPALSDLRAFARLLRYFRQNQFAFVQTHTPKASLIGLPAAKLAGQTTLYTMHGSLYFRGNPRLRNAAGWVFEKWCCLWADCVLTQSQEDTHTMGRVHICPARKLHYIGNGIDLARFTPAPARPAVSKPTVLMVSRLVAEKGCRDFFRMAEQLGAAASFVHAGPFEPDQRDAISQEEADRLQATGTVKFLGEVRDVRLAVAGAAVVVLPSYREGIPRAAMEAAAMGKPVVAYDIRGVREVIPPATGLLAPLGDVTELSRRVESLLADDEAREAAGAACREWVSARFSEEAVFGRLRSVYGGLD